MTNIEVLQGSLIGSFTDVQLNAVLVKQGLDPSAEYKAENERKIDFATASLLFTLSTMAESVKELDYAITNRSSTDLLAMIKAIYAKWGVRNPYANDKIKGSRPW